MYKNTQNYLKPSAIKAYHHVYKFTCMHSCSLVGSEFDFNSYENLIEISTTKFEIFYFLRKLHGSFLILAVDYQYILLER